jgi:DNA helicase HerA-like ATPase
MSEISAEFAASLPRPNNAALGHIDSISGSQALARVRIDGRSSGDGATITVGRFVKIETGRALIVGIVTDIAVERASSAGEHQVALARIDLMGQIEGDATGTTRFKRGVADYPTIGDAVLPLSHEELRAVFQGTESNVVEIGNLHQDDTVTACVDVDELLSKHFAVLGSTGVGKSSAVALILQQVLQARPNVRIFMLDAHNEYGRCFGNRAQVITPSNLKLPFWLFNFEEIVDVFFSGRPGIEAEVEILSEVIPLAKAAYTQYKATERLALKKLDAKNVGFTVDTPVPYRLADLLNLIDERMGKLENRSSRMNYHKLITRIETVSNDPRYSFMFENANVGGDTMAEAISQLFRLPPNGKPMTIMQLAGFPTEVVDAVVSVLSRIAFDFGLWSDGAAPLLFVCEEAHRYASTDHSYGFAPTRRAIARIAKEGRKYGVFLGLVTQRPAELDPTIISQCSTLFAMRMSNDRDQALLRSAVSDAAANLLAFVPSLGTREALAFGVGVPLPTRFRFSELPEQFIPRSEALAGKSELDAHGHDLNFIASVVKRWRGATLNHRRMSEEPLRELKAAVSPQGQPAQTPEQRFSLLRKPLSDRGEPSESLLRGSPPGQPSHWEPVDRRG